MENQGIASSHPGSSLIAGLAGVARNSVGLLLSRIELAALELAEVRNHVLALILVFVLGVVAAWFAIAFWAALVVFLAWDILGWKILLIVAAVFTAAAVALFFYARAMVRQEKLSLPATMAELRVDRDALL